MTTNQKASTVQLTKNVLLHLMLVATMVGSLYLFFYNNGTIQPPKLLQWDGPWYLSIATIGYSYVENGQNNTAFFPLFPLVWKYSTLGVLGISIFNFSIFLVAFYLIAITYNASKKVQLSYLSIPPLLFFLVPYSESLFFMFSTLILIGFKRNNWTLALIGFILATLTRSAATVFIPALLITAFFITNKSKLRNTAIEYLSYGFACVLTTFLVIYWQFIQTGVWFASAKTQKHWEHFFRLPKLPISGWGKIDIVLLDSMSLLLGIFSIFILLFFLIKKVKNTKIEVANSLIFSLLYIAGISTSILLFQGGDIHSLNRYLLCTPFFFILLVEFSKIKVSLKQLTYIIIFVTIFFISCGSYLHGKLFLYYFGLSLVVALYFLSFYKFSERINKWSFVVLYILSTSMQAYCFVSFINGEWIG